MKKIFAFVLLTFTLSPLLLAASAEPYPFEVEEQVWPLLKPGPNFQTFASQKNPFQFWTKDKITAESKGSLQTEGHLVGTYIFQGVPFRLILNAGLKEGTVESVLNISRLDELLAGWLEKYEKPKVWRFKAAALDSISYEEGKGFGARWKVKSKLEYVALARMAQMKSDGAVEDVTGILGRYQDFVNFIEADEKSILILQNNKSGVPAYLDYEGPPEFPNFFARHPMHQIIWDERKDYLRFEFLDVLSDVQKIPEIKRILEKKEVRSFVGSDYSKVRVKDKGSDREGIEVFLFKPEEKRGLMIKLKGRKVIQMEEIKG